MKIYTVTAQMRTDLEEAEGLYQIQHNESLMLVPDRIFLATAELSLQIKAIHGTALATESGDPAYVEVNEALEGLTESLKDALSDVLREMRSELNVTE
ncbi:hypothetical protein [Streptomyces sp. H39-C1]|uniref:hypothetical protein n=1 Tax=Streptomyces sp. H39-C1 TaxID=3004355 RepID=UPI0022AEDA54|nr:hypothetical protein [Streptomyces sp. H39-C1]MCZ4100800.1 hypothetical protein [Streptomyces sp. H39-C1]